jgi:hypothetical protein
MKGLLIRLMFVMWCVVNVVGCTLFGERFIKWQAKRMMSVLTRKDT